MSKTSVFRRGIVSLVSICLLFSVSCKRNQLTGEGSVTTSTRDVSTFENVVVKLPADVMVNVGSEPFGVYVKTNENLHEHVKTEVANSTLKIFSDANIWHSDKMEVVINTSSINGVRVSGAADVEVTGHINVEAFELRVSGASKIDVKDLNAKSLVVKSSGASKISVDSGAVDNAQYKMSGASKVYAYGLMSKSAVAKVSGASKMELSVSDNLDAKITGAGKIKYKGSPTVSSKTTGAGSVTQQN